MASKLKAVRVLTLLTLFDEIFEANRVLNLEPNLIKSLKESGQVDDTPAAVKYCTEELGVIPVTPEKPDAEKVAELEKLDLAKIQGFLRNANRRRVSRYLRRG